MEILSFFAAVMMVMFHHLGPLICLIIMLLFRQQWSLCWFFAAAIIWCFLHEKITASQPIPQSKNPAYLEGYIASIPTITPNRTQFQLDLTKFNKKKFHGHVLISCYKHCVVVYPGEKWELMAKIKYVKGPSNPGSFDYQRFLSSRHITYTAITIGSTFTRKQAPKFSYPWLQLRAYLAHKLQSQELTEDSLGILSALTLGLTAHIQTKQWELFRRTGTTHLMVISGAHIGLVGALVYKLMRFLWSLQSSLCLFIPAQKISSIISMLIVFIYALLSGFAPPSARACIICLLMLLRYVSKQRYGIWQALRYALIIVIVLEPHAVLMPGFHLSFFAVTCLILIHQRFKVTGIKQVILSQVTCLIGLMPLTLFLFSYGAINGLIANILAIPWVSFIIIPSALTALIIMPFIHIPWLMSLIHWEISKLIIYLQFVDRFSLLNVSASIPTVMALIACVIALLVMLFIPNRRLFPAVFIYLIASFYPYHERIKPGEMRVDVLDVGQGLAIVVRTATHVLIYDAGGKIYHGADFAERVMLPYFKAMDVTKVDKIVISHPDLDHRGGLATLEKWDAFMELIVDNPNFYHKGVACNTYPDWNWDGVNFHFLPLMQITHGKNNTSCVLKISAKSTKILFTGDIEQQAEHNLLAKYGRNLSADLLIVPHHGSKTSSTDAFLDVVHPSVAIFSYGENNRYHFPHKEVLRRYDRHGIQQFNTVDCGMVDVHVTMHDFKVACFAH